MNKTGRRLLKIKRKTKKRWTEQELELLGKVSDVEIAKRFGRTLSCIERKRQRLGIASQDSPWMKPAEKALLGTMKDEDLAGKLGCSVLTVKKWRRRLKIPPFAAKNRPWTKKELRMLKKYDAAELAGRLNRDLEKVRRKRAAFKPAKATNSRRWSKQEIALLQKHTDLEVAELTGRSLQAVWHKRVPWSADPMRANVKFRFRFEDSAQGS